MHIIWKSSRSQFCAPDLADCFRIAARVGDLDLYTSTDDSVASPPQNIDVEQIIRHPEYRRTFSGLKNDIALIRLKSDIVYSGR